MRRYRSRWPRETHLLKLSLIEQQRFDAWWKQPNAKAFPSVADIDIEENFGEEDVMRDAFSDCWNAALAQQPTTDAAAWDDWDAKALAQQAQPKCVRCDSEATYDVLCASCQKDRHHPDHEYGDDAHAFVTAQRPETPTIQREQIEALRVTRVPKNDGDSIRIDGWNYALAAVLALFAPTCAACHAPLEPNEGTYCQPCGQMMRPDR